MATALSPQRNPPGPAPWHEVTGADGAVRPLYGALLENLGRLRTADLRALDDRMAATLREMGVNFDVIRNDPWGRQPWTCDLLPHIFASEDWALLVAGFRQRLRAFEYFLADVYGKREILRAGAVPIHAVLGSPHFQNACINLPCPRGAYLHLSGMCVARDARGAWQVKHHHFGHATGISYMMQNRRALARVLPDIFQDTAVQSLAEMPLAIMERLRETSTSRGGEPAVVLLSPGAGSAVSSEQSFLARRMGIPVVQGGDLLVLDDCVYLKTVRGLERVDVIYNRVADVWIDPLAFRSDSRLGVPGMVHCLRKGTVALVNAVGTQLADDRSLLAFASQIIRFYLNETPVLPTVPTHWLGDIDQREMVLENLEAYRIRPISREDTSGSWERAAVRDDEVLRQEIRKNPSHFVAQPRSEGAPTICFDDGQRVEHPQDHILFAVRSGADFDVFPGALTRVFSRTDPRGEFGFGWTSKDSWVLADESTNALLPTLSRRSPHADFVPRQVTSRVAESFYWMGRYLERAHHQAYLIQVVETLETEELNTAERKAYRPVWNRLLPPLEKSAGTSRRSIANRLDRYRLVLLPEPGSVVSTFLRAMHNAESVQDSLSPEAWATLSELRLRFQRTRYRDGLTEPEAVRQTRKMTEAVTQLIPQFFAIAGNTMLADDGWRFCEIGQSLERAVITANSALSLSGTLAALPGKTKAQASEIELSVFLRMLGCRDAYRRIFQMRAEPIPVLELLWQHREVPRSVLRCLSKCGALLRESLASEMPEQASAPLAIEGLVHQIKRVEWQAFVGTAQDEDQPGAKSSEAPHVREEELEPLLGRLLQSTMDVHTVIADSFLNHQARIAQVTQPLLRGF
ncbi:MAG: circularly permuted type 2 ATP-grasp protein [Chthoniobacter sp.]|uniref:circularly permuted type 2 ATP-grasp protein n=1 Tax=Chthoniobacter sp. TaxID=2510640 RepID=UPI0032A9FFC6